MDTERTTDPERPHMARTAPHPARAKETAMICQESHCTHTASATCVRCSKPLCFKHERRLGIRIVCEHCQRKALVAAR